MGIRIHKAIGYGLDDVQYDKDNWEMIDPRIRQDGYLGLNAYDNEEKFTDKGFDEYLDRLIKETPEDETFDLKLTKRTRESSRKENGQYEYKDAISHNVIYDPEFGMSNVALFIPPVFGGDWQRYDDIIDYYEPSHHDYEGGIDSNYLLLNRSIWPFDSYVDLRTSPPTRLTDIQFRLYVDSKNSTKYKKRFEQALCEEMGFESIDEAHNMINAIIPAELVAMLKYLKVFNDEADIHRLKPMIYWYWS